MDRELRLERQADLLAELGGVLAEKLRVGPHPTPLDNQTRIVVRAMMELIHLAEQILTLMEKAK